MNTFIIKKKSGTYSELLEAYGLSNTLHEILTSLDVESDVDIDIISKDLYYEITTSIDITEEMINKLNYFWLFKYIKLKKDSDVSFIEDVEYYDYAVQKEWRKERNEELQKIYKEYQGKDKKKERNLKINELENLYNTHKRLDIEFDVYSQISSPNNFSGFDKLYKNIFLNKKYFNLIISEILNYYVDGEYDSKISEKILKKEKVSFIKSITATQLYNPSQGQGLNKPKADGLNRKNFDSSWISETMKISGALSDMICQLVKVGSSYDLKVFVPEYKNVKWGYKSTLMSDFKRHLKGNTPIKIDVLNILLLTQKVLEHSEHIGHGISVDNVIKGLHSVYQKDLGKNKAVVNIGFIRTPNFIVIGNRDENLDWIRILEEQGQIIRSMDEDKGAIKGLMKYRDFISASNIECFFDFSFWYAEYLLNRLSNNKFAKAFTIESLNKLYSCMDTQNLRLMEIINNKGFQAIAKAIRKSTVSLQYTPKDARQYDIRYGVVPTLQTKSRSSEDLATFIGNFISTYNAETARYAEKNGKSLRINVREDELNDFYSLLDKYPSQLVGALLASYGFSLPKKDSLNQIDEEDDDNTDEL
jgi:hypothetical protein